MAVVSIPFSYQEDGEYVDPDEVVLEDLDDEYGVKDSSNNVLVAAGTAMVRDSLGVYSYDVTLTDGVLYYYSIKWVISGIASYREGTLGGESVDPPEPEEPTGNFTSRSLVRDYLGDEGVDLLLDDLGATPTSEFDRAVQEADDYILMHLLERYAHSQLTTSTWVQRRATELACFFLFQRRGQQPPTGLAESFMRITDELERISKNIKMLVPGAKPRESQGPALSNYVVDDMQLAHRLRTDTIDSVNEGGYPGRRDYVDLGGIAPL